MAGWVMALACGPKTGSEDDGADGSESGSESAGTTGTTNTATVGTTTAGTTGTTTVGTTATTAETTAAESDSGVAETAPGETGNLGCGDVPCDGDSYCDWVANTCGAERWDEVECSPQPSKCELGRPVCGCDGNVYDGECLAGENGVDVAQDGGCMPPEGTFPCGWYFCELGTSYCGHTASDVLPSPDSWSCPDLPPGCGDTPSCDCLVDEPCAEFGCDVVEGGGLMITCPGG